VEEDEYARCGEWKDGDSFPMLSYWRFGGIVVDGVKRKRGARDGPWMSMM
jgi:hypothetical protein